MLLSLLLLKKIASLLIILVIGFLLVRLKAIKIEHTGCISAFVAYVLNPSVMISSLQREFSPSLVKGIAFNFAVSLAVMLAFIAVTKLFSKPLHLEKVDEASLEYPSVASLVVPLVTSVLGSEYVIYVIGYFMVQQIFIWSHMNKLLSRGTPFRMKKLLLNPNILALAIGTVLFVSNLQLPSFLGDTVQILTDMLGPMSMLVAGLLLGSMDLKKTVTNWRVWLTVLGRLIVLPLIILVLMKLSHVSTLIEHGETLLLIVLLGASGPPTSLIISLAQLNGEDAGSASAINAICTVLCVVTIPFIVFLYQLWA